MLVGKAQRDERRKQRTKQRHSARRAAHERSRIRGCSYLHLLVASVVQIRAHTSTTSVSTSRLLPLSLSLECAIACRSISINKRAKEGTRFFGDSREPFADRVFDDKPMTFSLHRLARFTTRFFFPYSKQDLFLQDSASSGRLTPQIEKRSSVSIVAWLHCSWRLCLGGRNRTTSGWVLTYCWTTTTTTTRRKGRITSYVLSSKASYY